MIGRRSLLICALGGLVGACSERLDAVSKTVAFAVTGMPDALPSREAIETMPYATLAAKIGNGPRSLLVLGEIAPDGRLHWVSADRAVIVTRKGRLMRTAGMPTDLAGTRFIGDDPVGMPLARTPPPLRRLVDIPALRAFSVPIDSKFDLGGDEEFTILGVVRKLQVLKEACVSEEMGWKFENKYWRDPGTGFCWASTQHFAPDMPPIETWTLKPAGGAAA